MRHFHGTYKAAASGRAAGAGRILRLRLGGLQRCARQPALPSGAPACARSRRPARRAVGTRRVRGGPPVACAARPRRAARPSARARRAQPRRRRAQAVCDKHDPEYYPRFKAWADEYFYCKHREQRRGLGGIFFDDLNSKPRDEARGRPAPPPGSCCGRCFGNNLHSLRG